MSMHIKISAGSLKNRILKNIPAVKGHREFTPGIIKEAVFSICNNLGLIEENINFIDLFAGSGSLVWEAYSRGFRNISFCEKDSSRFKYILESKENFKAENINWKAHNKDFEYLLKKTDTEKQLVIFADPPYGQKRKGQDVLELIFHKYLENKLSRGSVVFFQLPSIRMQKNPPDFFNENWELRNYGSNSLLIRYF